jgi:hypothetical protein
LRPEKSDIFFIGSMVEMGRCTSFLALLTPFNLSYGSVETRMKVGSHPNNENALFNNLLILVPVPAFSWETFSNLSCRLGYSNGLAPGVTPRHYVDPGLDRE